MAQYLLAYHGGGMPETEADQQAVMKAWEGWMGGLGSALVNPGNQVGGGSTVSSDGSVSSGQGANPITGYSIVEADSLDAAATHAKGCPILTDGGNVEIAEIYPM